MKGYSWAAVLIGLAMCPTLAQAQVKFVSFKPDSGNELRHGRNVNLTVKGKEQPVVGTVVRYDPKTGQVYVRTSPGLAPQVIAKNDIVKAEKKSGLPDKI